MVGVLEVDPALGRDLSPSNLAMATAQAIAPTYEITQSRWTGVIADHATGAHLGLLMLDGLMARHISIGAIGSTEFLGPRDLMRPWGRTRVPGDQLEVRWEVLAPARIAVLDRAFALRISPWPELIGALLERSVDRVDSQLVQSALRQTTRVEDRVLLALWHFADRWGEVTAEGRRIDLPKVTGAILAGIVGARRQSVSTALGRLTDRGAIRREPDGSWTIPHRPSQLERIEPGRRAADNVRDETRARARA
jgi:CRP/FNR family cyclic AMP-dependent transcriptional regulator